MAKLHCVFAAALLLASPTSAQPTIVDNAKLANVLSKISSFKPRDQFEPGPAQELRLGQQFRLSWLVREDKAQIGSRTTGYWTYDVNTQTLTVVIGSFIDPGAYYFQTSSSAPHNYAAQNGYGAKTTVRRFESIGFGVRSVAVMPPLEWKAPLPAEVARSLVSKLKIEMSGTLAGGQDGASAFCARTNVAPTLQSPTEAIMVSCTASANIQSVSLVRTDTGETLQRWGNRPS